MWWREQDIFLSPTGLGNMLMAGWSAVLSNVNKFPGVWKDVIALKCLRGALVSIGADNLLMLHDDAEGVDVCKLSIGYCGMILAIENYDQLQDTEMLIRNKIGGVCHCAKPRRAPLR